MDTKFLNNSVDYCEEYGIKKSLSKYIQAYNKYLYNYKKGIHLNDNKECELFIPNNNKKFFLYIFKHHVKNSYVLYFFPDKNCKMYFSTFLLIKNTINDFFIECDMKFDDQSYLLEGYLYGNSTKQHFLITDILFRNGNIIQLEYSNRLHLINELFFNKISKMNNINNVLSIGIHNCINHFLINVFLNNFIWKNEIICIETIRNFEKKTEFLPVQNNNTGSCLVQDQTQTGPRTEPGSQDVSSKKIVKTKVSEIYNVYNIQTNDFEGILYIDTLKTSRYLLSLFRTDPGLSRTDPGLSRTDPGLSRTDPGLSRTDQSRDREHDEIIIDCIFNTYFQKWQIVLRSQ
jgi:hypothetical protein